MTNLLKLSFQKTTRNFWISILYYLLTLLLAAGPVWLFYGVLEKASRNKAVLNDLLTQFDFMVFADFMRENDTLFKPVVIWGLAAGFAGSLLYTFLSGGAVSAYLRKSNTPIGQFFGDSVRLFPKYLLLLFILGIHLFVWFLVCGLFFFVFALIAEGSSERGYLLWAIPPFVLLALSMGFGLCVNFYSKVCLALEKRLSVVDAFWLAFRYVLKRPETLGGFWLLALVGTGISFLYLRLGEWIGVSSAVTVFVILALQQLVVFSRSFLKNWNYAFAAGLVLEYPVTLWKEPDSGRIESVSTAENRIKETISLPTAEPSEQQEETEKDDLI